MKKVTHEEFLNNLKNVNENIEVLGIYTKAKDKIKVKCKICSHEWEATPNNLLRGRGCPKCKANKFGKSKLKLKEQFVEEANIIHNFKYDYSKFDYKTSHEKGIVICPIHGEFEVSPANHLSGRNCPKCAIEHRAKLRALSTEEFIEKARKIHGDKYDYSKVNYINNYTLVSIICHKKDFQGIEHGEFLQQPNNHLNGKGCPKCRQSHGERFITNYLNNNKIKFIPQYSIEINKDINISGKANIDFYLPDYNLFIEYNGIQHYVERQAFGGKIDFERQQKRDEYVRNYCKENDIRLLEIPYILSWEEVTKLLNTTIYE